MRYYLYLSTAKVDMLYEQIPPKLLKRLAVEAKVDLKVLSLAVQSPRTEASTYDRLDIVESYLERESDVSWMTEPTAWFRGDLALRIAGYGAMVSPTFMTGSDGDTLVALIGSAHHLIGYEPAPDMHRIGHSALPSMFQLLRDDADRRAERPSRGGVLHEVLEFSEALEVPPVSCEFLARRLTHGSVTMDDGRELAIVVGTPLYVAMAEEHG
ncbi:DUF7019 family protein [Streptomyces aureocirculatus]|uniref:DUF7019 family protein n=1 Tax=Streptomyces aureocirculatus TaxID=67275 RepID=UPI0004CA02D4|nr:SAVMC3_10250 family protein [Streptomyces aureocirculatus]